MSATVSSRRVGEGAPAPGWRSDQEGFPGRKNGGRLPCVMSLAPRSASLRVEIDAVTKTYPPAVRALRGVSAVFEPSRVSVVLGANGSGKSTLLGIIGTLARATSGRV